jgi:hypothetical protein
MSGAMTQSDGRPRLFINGTGKGPGVRWSRHPAARPTFAHSAGAALDAALAETDGPMVVIFEPRPPS